MKVKKAAAYLRKKISTQKPAVGVIMGSGLTDSMPSLRDKITLPYEKIPGFMKTTVEGHKGELIFGRCRRQDLVIMRGRFHYYEGMPMNCIAMPIRILSFLGVKTLIVTAAVGSMKKKIKPGDLMILTDHINFMGSNSLIGNYSKEFGEMFPDMSKPYDRRLSDFAFKTARRNSFRIHRGVYFAVSGPSYETSAEVKAYRMLGGDVVGMSVVPEVTAARQLGMKVVGICWVSNFASGISPETLEHKEVLELGKIVSPKIKMIIEETLAEV